MTNPQKNTVCFIENLTCFTWFFYVVNNLRGLKKANQLYSKVYYIDATVCARYLARATAFFLQIHLLKLDFKLIDVKDQDGDLTRFSIAEKDLFILQRLIEDNPVFQAGIKNFSEEFARFQSFLKKDVVSFTWFNPANLWRVLLLLYVLQWKEKQEFGTVVDKVLFADNRCWKDQLQNYAKRFNTSIVFCKYGKFNCKSILRTVIGEFRLRYFYYKFLDFILSFKSYENVNVNDVPINITDPKILVEYYGHLTADDPGLFSDLFFLHNSGIVGKNVVVSFNSPADPVDKEKYEFLAKHNIHGLAMHPKATKVRNIPRFNFLPRVKSAQLWYRTDHSFRDFPRTENKQWVEKEAIKYCQEVQYWEELFRKYNVKLFLSWYDFDTRPHIIAEALNRVNGVGAIYQRAYKDIPSVQLNVDIDLKFSFSNVDIATEKGSGSVIPYCVITGYIGDYRIPYLKKYAEEIRAVLFKNGAKSIMAFFDENSASDVRWHTGHEFMSENYAFLLNKVLSEPWFGLVLKPKSPYTLLKRLGKVKTLLNQAIETGRCYLIDAGGVQSSFPPAVAAMASDIAVHGHLFAATAGIESILAGKPTLFMDREGCSLSSLYNVKKGKVVFKDWGNLWGEYFTYKRDPLKFSELGDCSEILDELDPFRDGKGGFRVSQYLKGILDGYEQGLSKDAVLQKVAQEYRKQWGDNKIVKIKC